MIARLRTPIARWTTLVPGLAVVLLILTWGRDLPVAVVVLVTDGNPSSGYLRPNDRIVANRAELHPLTKYADRPITSVGFTSAKLLGSVGTRPSDIDGMLEMANAALQKAPLTDEQRTKLLKDLNGLAKEWKESLPKPADRPGD